MGDYLADGTSKNPHADVLLVNARLITPTPFAENRYYDKAGMSRGAPAVEADKEGAPEFVAVTSGKIVGVGPAREARRFKCPRTREIDCQGMTLAPGFIDAHCHILGLASSLRGVDCGPENAASISQIAAVIRRAADGTDSGSYPAGDTGLLKDQVSPGESSPVPPENNWIRAFGYDEFYLLEKRHPTRWDLDRAAPFRPVRLDHRTGHASVLNSHALRLLNISRDTPDPTDGVVERDGATGEPTGVLFDMASYLSSATKTTRAGVSGNGGFLEGIRRANGLLLSKGVTSIQDASPGNDLCRWQILGMLKKKGYLTPRVTMMAGSAHLQSLADEGLKPGSGDEELKIGAVKVVLGLTTGTLHPHRDELREVVLRAHEKGFQLAIHAVEEEAVEAAADVLLDAQAALCVPDARHRIEHCSECPPRVVEKLRKSRAIVVTQPSFLYHSGEKYLALVEEGLQPHLYPLGSLMEAGIPVAAGSDAPVASPDPVLGIYSSVSRRSKGGHVLSPTQAVSVHQALIMHARNGAYASFDETQKGSVMVGKLADLVLLDNDPRALEPEAIKEIKVMMTIIGGEIVWTR